MATLRGETGVSGSAPAVSPAPARIGRALRPVIRLAGRGVRTTLVTLTRPLPDHVADYREPARSVLVFAVLVIVTLTLGISPQQLDRRVLLVLVGTGVAFGAASLIRRMHPLLSRCDGLVGLTLIAGLVVASGAATSIYRPLLVLLLLYAAMFFDTARLAATGLLIGAVIVVPPVLAGMEDAAAGLLVEIPVWALLAGVVHALVHRSRATARTDGLTGLSNHVTFQSLLRAEHERMRRYGSPYSVLLLDLDHFKRINDLHGHPVGDEVLRGVAKVLRQRARITDTVARYGGEEFAFLLPETTREQATTVAEHLCAVVRDAELALPVTVSVGVASSADGLEDTAEGLLAAADQALYAAKRGGRNRVGVNSPQTAARTYLSEVV